MSLQPPPVVVGLVVEEELGHRAYGARLRRRLGAEPRVRLVDLPVHPGLEGPWEHRWPFRSNETLRKSLRAARLLRAHRKVLDVVLVHTQTAALLARPVLGPRVAVAVSTDGTPANIDELGAGYGHRPGSSLVEEVKRRITAVALRRADAVVAWSRWCLRTVVDVYGVDPARARVLSPGVDTSFGSSSGVRRRLGEGGVRLLMVAGDFRRKGGADLLRAVAELRGEWSLDVVTEVDVDVQDPRVRIHGPLHGRREELLALYRRADVFVLPTRGDTFGLVLLEAMAAGLPVVSTRVGAVPELVQDGATGLVVPAQDVPALVGALQRLVDDHGLRDRLGRTGRARALERHDAEVNEQVLVDLLVRLGESARRRRRSASVAGETDARPSSSA